MVMQMFHRTQEDERFVDSVILSDESTFYVRVRSIPTTAGSGAAKIHVSPRASGQAQTVPHFTVRRR
jgi:hypothetical protein